MEVTGSVAVQLQYPLSQAGGAVVARILRHLHTGSLRQQPHRLHVVQVFDAADKVDDIAGSTAAEAEEGLGIGVDGKGGGLFAVERAKPRKGASPPPQVDIAAHHLLNIAAVFQLLQKLVGQHTLSPPFSSFLV